MRRLMHAVMLIIICLLPAIACVCDADAGESGNAAEKRRVLLLSGQNNHNWRETTPRIREILEESGRFIVDVTTPPEGLTAEALEAYDVIISNWNTFTARYQAPREDGWSDEAKKAYLDFVRNGKGHVVIHAGSSSFYDWPDYQQLVITGFKVGQTDHGTLHTFPVRIDETDHPVTRGLKSFNTFDELWHNAPIAEGGRVLASAFSSTESGGSGKYEPAVMVRQFGKGRSFTTLLGHDAKAMESKGFQTLLVRGTEWAATGKIAPDQVEDEKPVESPPLRWEQTDESVALVGPNGVIWQFNYGQQAAKPFFHPLALTTGEVLTWQAPPDHPWHHGLWFCWKYINGVNYWEENLTTGRSDGLTRWSNVRIQTRHARSARIDLDLAYEDPNGKTVLTERRTVRISAPDSDGQYHLDWKMTFTAGEEDVVLDRTPLPDEPGGQIWGGYAGLSVRLAKDLKDRQVITVAGPVSFEDDRHRCRSPYMDYTGMIGDTPAGIAILDDRGNLERITPWYAIRSAEMSFFSPAVICYGPHTLPAGRSMTLQYRVIVHPDRWDKRRLASEARSFRNRPRP
jgi:type 1 glutamine amidotransferase